MAGRTGLTSSNYWCRTSAYNMWQRYFPWVSIVHAPKKHIPRTFLLFIASSKSQRDLQRVYLPLLGCFDLASIAAIFNWRQVSQASECWPFLMQVSAAGSTVSSAGSGRNGRLGHGWQASCSSLTQIEAIEQGELLQVACGLDHTLLLVQDSA